MAVLGKSKDQTISEQVVTRQPAISFSISFQHPFNSAGGRTSNVLQKLMRPLLITMGILSFFSSSKGQDKPHDHQPPAAIAVDLKEFKIGSTTLGSPIAPADPFHAALKKAEVFKPVGQGLEVGTKNGLLDYGFFDISSFKGSFTSSGEPIKIGKDTTEKDIVKAFGEPYC